MPSVKPNYGALLNRAHPLAQELVGCWLFNEGSGGIVADACGGANGTLVGMDPATDWVGGPVGSALDFDGAGDQVTLPALAGLSGTAASLAIRVRLRNQIPSIGGGGLARFSTGENCNYPFPDSYIYAGWLRTNRINTIVPKVDMTQWHWFVCTTSPADGWKLYQNQVQISSGANESWTLGTTSAPPGLGYWDSTRVLDGQISDAYFWLRGLPLAEITQFIFQPFAMFAPPRRLWLFKGAAAPPSTYPYYYREFLMRPAA